MWVVRKGERKKYMGRIYDCNNFLGIFWEFLRGGV